VTTNYTPTWATASTVTILQLSVIFLSGIFNRPEWRSRWHRGFHETWALSSVTSRVDRITVMSFSPGFRRSSSSNCNVLWMRRPAFWLVRGSSTVAWRSWCMTISTSLTCLSASSIKSSSWLVAASSVPRHGIYSCRLCSCLRDDTETSSLRCWLSACHAVVPSELMWPSGVFYTQSETMELFAYSVSQKKSPLGDLTFFSFYSLFILV